LFTFFSLRSDAAVGVCGKRDSPDPTEGAEVPVLG